jgi:hypothetical protein
VPGSQSVCSGSRGPMPQQHVLITLAHVAQEWSAAAVALFPASRPREDAPAAAARRLVADVRYGEDCVDDARQRWEEALGLSTLSDSNSGRGDLAPGGDKRSAATGEQQAMGLGGAVRQAEATIVLPAGEQGVRATAAAKPSTAATALNRLRRTPGAVGGGAPPANGGQQQQQQLGPR